MPDPVLCSLLRIDRMRLRALRRDLAPYGYGGVMHLILHCVSSDPGVSQEQVACFFALDKTSVARDARKLEEMGHIRREIDPANRRRYRMYLTAEGEQMMQTIFRAYDDFARKLSEGLPQEDWQQLKRILGRLEENALSNG